MASTSVHTPGTGFRSKNCMLFCEGASRVGRRLDVDGLKVRVDEETEDAITGVGEVYRDVQRRPLRGHLELERLVVAAEDRASVATGEHTLERTEPGGSGT